MSEEKHFYMGCNIKTVSITEDKKALIFELKNQTYLQIQGFIIFARGGCCSQSWFQEVPDFDSLEGVLIKDIKLSEPHKTQETYERTVTKYHKVSLLTDQGSFDFELRNESNGYYEGELEIFKLVNRETINTYDIEGE